ncbi:hypothetical protein [Azospirillum argentinense]
MAGTQETSHPQVSQHPVNNFGRAQLFLTKYNAAAKEAAARRQDAKAAKRVRRNPLRNAEDVQRYIDQARTLNALKERRLSFGFQWFGGYVGGSKSYYRSAFVYRGLVSDENPILKAFVAKTHAKKNLRTGRTKEESEESPSKLLSLDDAYVCVNGDMRGVFRMELDAIFESEDDLRQMLYEALDGDGGRIILPNVIVGYVDARGRIHNPHLIWILQDSITWTSKKADPSIKRMFAAVARGLCARLLHLGCDPGGLDNMLRMKNPLSPLWDRWITTADLYTMSELAESVDMTVSRAQLESRQAEVIIGPTVELKNGGVIPSNRFFHDLRAYACSIVAEHKAGGSFGEFRAEIAMEAMRISADAKERQARGVACRVADRIWEDYDPSKAQTRRLRKGILMDSVDGLDLAERQAVGGRFSAGETKAESIRLGVDAVLALRAEGKAVTQDAVAKAAGRCLRTVKAHWRAIRAAVDEADAKAAEAAAEAADVLARVLAAHGATRCIVKKNAATGPAKAAKQSDTVWIPIPAHGDPVERASAIRESWEDSVPPPTPSCTFGPDDPWEGFGILATPSCTMASTPPRTPSCTTPLRAVEYVDVPF